MPINPLIMRWARQWRGRSLEAASDKLQIPVSKIISWESGETHPTVRQARILAEFYDRPFLEFLLDSPPELSEPEALPDFRLHKETDDPHEKRELKYIQAWAEEQRVNAVELFDIIGESPPKIPAKLNANLNDQPEAAAKLSREAIGFSIKQQTSLTSREGDSLPRILRRFLEMAGILVLKESSLVKFSARGMCIFKSPLPIIVFGTEAPSAQVFTMSHELGHIVLQMSAISGPPSQPKNMNTKVKVESWCNKFAGAFLAPLEEIEGILGKVAQPSSEIADDLLENLSSHFHISRHAMLIRLVHIGYIAPEYYWDKKLAEFLAEEKKYKSFARSKYYGSRYRNALGDMYTGLVLDAWDDGHITNHNAAEFMGIKNIRHLNDIRSEFD
ncbi:XRE family transcriptional regulator [Roseomonas sp. OT10]|uniref:XRE family transcriptional regulator n=1 Tax=Roseomonas cutis TaxID=2897332 RepID=UPI001E3D55A3|nr:XRE family transcriptional regulator [Roseomonas sp. OT10]UFN50658.1 XRE family transcriptional regulator [Roseomonas sp. OT10]